MNTKRILQVIILILLAVVAWLLWPKLERPQSQYEEINVTDFTSCQLAGGEIIDGEPVKCRTSDGREFTEAEHTEPDVVLVTPQYGDMVSSPLTVTGRAKGTWFFEANLPVTLKDETGKVLAQKGFMATEDWMTVDYVDFTGTLEFDPGDAQFGVLVIERDNPSGLPQFDASFAIPVRFK